MARYHYTRENENGVVLYLESEPAEDAMDEFDDEIAVGFSGNGYLRFWTRCRRAAEALPNGLKYAAGGRCVITDTFTGEEKEVGYIFPLMKVEPTICIELKDEEDEG